MDPVTGLNAVPELPALGAPTEVSLNAFITSLENVNDGTAHLQHDAEAEAIYMRSHQYRFARTLRALPRAPLPSRILDIGPTPFTLFLGRSSGSNCEVWALDRSDLLREPCERSRVRLCVCDLDNETLPFESGYFDVVICTEVLEHVFAPPSDVLKGIHRILKDDGKLILSVPNLASLRQRVQLLLGRSPLSHPDNKMKKDWIHGHGHLHEYVKGELLGILRGCGFSVQRCEYQRRSLRCALAAGERTYRSRLVRTLYHFAQSSWPSFASTILAECVKSQTSTAAS